MSYKAVIFDLDGTLIDSLEDLADAVNCALSCFGLQVHSLQSFRKMVGDGTRTLISRALPADKQQLLEPVLDKMRQRYFETCLNKSRPYKGIEAVLAKLKKAAIKMAVLTNKDQKMAQKMIEHFFGKDCFNVIRGTFDSIAVKPDPAALLEVLEKLGVNADEAVFVGDSNIDIHTAKAAKMASIGVNWGFRGEDELRAAGADFVINQPNELLQYLQ